MLEISDQSMWWLVDNVDWRDQSDEGYSKDPEESHPDVRASTVFQTALERKPKTWHLNGNNASEVALAFLIVPVELEEVAVIKFRENAINLIESCTRDELMLWCSCQQVQG